MHSDLCVFTDGAGKGWWGGGWRGESKSPFFQFPWVGISESLHVYLRQGTPSVSQGGHPAKD